MRPALPAAIAMAAILVLAAAAPLLGLADPVHMDVAGRFAGPSPAHWLGQDELGRDVLSRLIWGGRVSLAVAFLSAAIAGLLGIALGLLGGYLRGVVELIALRTVDLVLCFPAAAAGAARRDPARARRRNPGSGALRPLRARASPASPMPVCWRCGRASSCRRCARSARRGRASSG